MSRFKSAFLNSLPMTPYTVDLRNIKRASHLLELARMIRPVKGVHVAAMDKHDVVRALSILNDELVKSSINASLKLYGSGVIILRFEDSRRISDDLDVEATPSGEVRQAAERVAAKLGLPVDWLNEDVKLYHSPRLEFTSDGMPEFSNLKIEALTTESLFGMKLRSDREADASDVAFLCRKLDIESMEQCEDILHKYYPNRDIMTNPMMGIMSYLGMIEEQDLFNTEKYKKD